MRESGAIAMRYMQVPREWHWLRAEVRQPVAKLDVHAVAPHCQPPLHQAGQRDRVAAEVDGRHLAVVMRYRPVPRTEPQVTVIVKGVVTHLAGIVGGKQLVPASAPNVVEGRAGVRAPQRHAWVVPEQIEPTPLVHEVEDFCACVREQGESHPIALEKKAGDALMHVRGVDDGWWHGHRSTLRRCAPIIGHDRSFAAFDRAGHEAAHEETLAEHIDRDDRQRRKSQAGHDYGHIEAVAALEPRDSHHEGLLRVVL